MNLGPRKRKVYRYTGEDCTGHDGVEIKNGTEASLADWGILIGKKYMTIYHHVISKHRKGISQDDFNRVINHSHEGDSGEQCKISINPEYLEYKKQKNAKITELLKKGYKSTYIAKLTNTSISAVVEIRDGHKANDIKIHKCKCPTCGEIYFRNGFYTGKGLWRKMHDRDKCPALHIRRDGEPAPKSRNSPFKSVSNVTLPTYL